MNNLWILLAEDDIDLGLLLIQYLELQNFRIDWVKTGKEALNILNQSKSKYDIAILDVMLPEMDGFQLAKKMVEVAPEIPFIFLTVRNLKKDKIKGFKLGADDYITKPFDVDILVLRIYNILRRTQQMHYVTEQKIQISTYSLDIENNLLTRENESQKLTEKEVALIHFLFLRKNHLIKRETILQEIWKNDDYFSGRSMDVFISRLRKYFKADSSIQIESRRGIGLIFHVTT